MLRAGAHKANRTQTRPMSPADREMQARLHQLQRDRTTAAKGEIPDQDGLRAALARRAATTGGQKRIQAHAQARARRRSPPPPPPPRLMVPDGLLNRSGGALWWLGLANGSAGWDACAAHVAAQRWHTKQRRRPGMSNAKLGCVARYMPPRSLAKRLLREPGTMVGRVGSIEAMGMVHLGSSDGGHSVSVRTLLQQNAGVFTTRVADRMPVMRRFFDEYGHAMVESDLEMLVAEAFLSCAEGLPSAPALLPFIVRAEGAHVPLPYDPHGSHAPTPSSTFGRVPHTSSTSSEQRAAACSTLQRATACDRMPV